MKNLKYFITAFIFMIGLVSFSQTTVSLSEQCQCSVLSGTAVAEAGATSPIAGAVGDLYMQTAQKKLYFWDGDSWELIESTSAVSGTTIESTVNNDNGTITFNYTDGTSFTTTSFLGEVGPSGSTGSQGPAGADGATGATGAAGADGAAGAAGAKGDKGDTGNTGAAGADGADGADGAAGATGAKGDKGDTGNTGAAGADGADGADGAAGADGADGAAGAKGDKGDTGAKGDKGDDGDDFNPSGTFFYPPSVALDVSTKNSTKTYDLYALYKREFTSPSLRSSGAPASIKTYAKTELYYYITDYDTDIFTNISINSSGVLTYKVKKVPSNDNTIINLVFVVK